MFFLVQRVFGLLVAFQNTIICVSYRENSRSLREASCQTEEFHRVGKFHVFELYKINFPIWN